MKKFLGALAASLFAFVASSFATVPAGITTLTTDTGDYRDDVWAFIIASVAFAVIIGWAMKLKGKRG